MWVEQEQRIDFRGFENLKNMTLGEFSWVEQEQRRTKKMMKNVLKNEQERSNRIFVWVEQEEAVFERRAFFKNNYTICCGLW